MKDSAERVGRYQLLAPIGTGPCGVVSRAKVYGVAGFERQFAVKRFHPELTITSPLAQALSSAARAYGSLEHPRIARMSEFGVAQGQTFTAVELVVGLDAARLVAEARLQGTALAAGGALALVSQAARAGGYAHGRGLTHLGLSPTNMIITPDGDVKITDFGLLAAGLPHRPVDTSRLHRRIQYLAPEQLAAEATSAATDVFQLGVIAYELVTGEATYRGDTPHAIAQAILAGPPADPPLPRPIVRVLARCLARSPFERFPDARALADALDAALRVAPVPGTRKDVGAQVQATMDRLATLHDGELSGMVALHIGTGPVTMSDANDINEEQSTVAAAIETSEFVRPDTPVPGPAPLVGPATNKPASPALPTPPAPGAKLPAASTMVGIAAVKGVPPIKPPAIPSAIPPVGKPATPTPAPVVARTKSTPEVVPPVTIPAVARTKSAPDVPPPSPPTRPTLQQTPPPSGASTPATSPNLPTPPLRRTAPAVAPPPPPADRKTGQNPVLPPEPPAVARTRSGLNVPASKESVPSLPPPPNALPRPAFPAPVTDKPSGGLDLESLFEGVITNAGQPAQSDDPIEGGATVLGNQTVMGVAPSSMQPKAAATGRSEIRTSEMPNAQREKLIAEAQRAPSVTDIGSRPGLDEVSVALDTPSGVFGPDTTPSVPPMPMTTIPGTPPPPARRVPSSSTPPPGASPNVVRAPATPPSSPATASAPSEAPASSLAADAPVPGLGVKKKSHAPLVLGIVLLAGGLGVGAWQVWERVLKLPDDEPGAGTVIASTGDTKIDAGTKPAVTVDAAVVVATPADAAEIAAVVVDAETGSAGSAGSASPLPDAADVATTPTDAAVVDAATPPPDASTEKPATPTPTGKSDQLSITSTPAGARVYIDGADSGVTPLKLPASPDKHTIALLLPGHELYIAQVDGSGKFQIPLTEVTPAGGPAGIKVIKCKDKDRYYVFVDGKPTGMLCPTERVNVEVGPHVVEIYDAVTETRRKWDVVVKDTRLSVRVKVE
ncbi:MAG: protein kinase [Kofleriaceae bacterium]|nr:protein kinase [Kofleriaceae bacterium]